MKFYAVFYYKIDSVYNVLGDRGTIIIDNRLSLENKHAIAKKWATQHNFNAYSFEKGESLLTSKPLGNKRYSI